MVSVSNSIGLLAIVLTGFINSQHITDADHTSTLGSTGKNVKAHQHEKVVIEHSEDNNAEPESSQNKLHILPQVLQKRPITAFGLDNLGLGNVNKRPMTVLGMKDAGLLIDKRGAIKYADSSYLGNFAKRPMTLYGMQNPNVEDIEKRPMTMFDMHNTGLANIEKRPMTVFGLGKFGLGNVEKRFGMGYSGIRSSSFQKRPMTIFGMDNTDLRSSAKPKVKRPMTIFGLNDANLAKLGKRYMRPLPWNKLPWDKRKALSIKDHEALSGVLDFYRSTGHGSAGSRWG